MQNTSNILSNHDHSGIISQFDNTKNIVFFPNDDEINFEEDEINKIALGVKI